MIIVRGPNIHHLVRRQFLLTIADFLFSEDFFTLETFVGEAVRISLRKNAKSETSSLR